MDYRSRASEWAFVCLRFLFSCCCDPRPEDPVAPNSVYVSDLVFEVCPSLFFGLEQYRCASCARVMGDGYVRKRKRTLRGDLKVRNFSRNIFVESNFVYFVDFGVLVALTD